MQRTRHADLRAVRRALALGLVAFLAAMLVVAGRGVAPVLVTVALGLLLVLAVPTLIRSAARSRSSRICWLVSLVVSALVLTPQLAVAHYKDAAAGVVGGVFWWLLLACLLRLVVFLADFFRSKADRSATTS